jgi:FtsH-binding integral membrane protein
MPLLAATRFLTPGRLLLARSSPPRAVVSSARAGLLIAAQCYKDAFPTNLYLTFGFTVALGWGVAVTCARFQQAGLGLVVLEAVGLTASVTAALTAYTLRSKTDFSYLGAGLGSALWVLIIGGLVAALYRHVASNPTPLPCTAGKQTGDRLRVVAARGYPACTLRWPSAAHSSSRST